MPPLVSPNSVLYSFDQRTLLLSKFFNPPGKFSYYLTAWRQAHQNKVGQRELGENDKSAHWEKKISFSLKAAHLVKSKPIGVED